MAEKVVNKADFFIAGMPRSGTTSLYTYLKQHPQVYLSLYKEPHFFSKDLTQSSYNIQDPQLYHSLFRDAGDAKAIGEGSVWYLTSQTAARAIVEYNPKARIIIMLRNPVDMIYSLHSLYLRTENENIVDFNEAVRAVPQRKQGRSIPPGTYFPEGLIYTEVGLYYRKIKRFKDVFHSRNIHFIIFDRFAAQTPDCFRETLEFLGLDPGFEAEFDSKKASAILRSKVIEQIRRAQPVVKQMLSKKTGKDSHMGPRRPPISGELKQELKSWFAQDLEKTSDLIGIDLTAWSK